MKVIIAEKPSVAREIAAIVGARTSREGYMEGNGYAVTWAFGHLITLALPEAYGIMGFERENLPIIPQEFKLIPRQIKDGKAYKNDPGALKQLKVIDALFSAADSIIVATDAGREGELIFRYIYNYLGCDKPFQRLWISSLTDRAIREGMENLRPGKQYDNLYLSAQARSQADWLVGINASQALAVTAGRGAWSLGRVQTPTLAIICERYLENKAFVPQTYFQVKLHTAKDATIFAALSADKFMTRDQAEAVYTAVTDAESVEVVTVERKEANEQPPLPYDLTALQKEGNSRHGFSADKTLSIAQSLYESKLITYPRTGSRYIPADVAEEIPALVRKLAHHPRFGHYAGGLIDKALNTRPVNDEKVTDHHAILPTENMPVELAADHRTIYDMIAGRMLEAFSDKCVKENTTVLLRCAGRDFTARGTIIVIPGWRMVFNNSADEKEDDLTILPDIDQGDRLSVKGADVIEKKTKPRPIHTESTLLAAMESAGCDLEDEAQREAMKEGGIGTPATRAAIIETLFGREYIRRDKKSLLPTEKGLAVYEIVKDKMIADVAMTGEWELALAKIVDGQMDSFTFRRGIEVYTAQITTEILSSGITVTENRPSVSCPRCGGTVVIYPKVAKCRNEDCALTVFREKAGKILTDKQLSDLLTKGRTGIIKGFRSRDETKPPFEAAIVFDAEFKTVFDFPETKPKTTRKTGRK